MQHRNLKTILAKQKLGHLFTCSFFLLLQACGGGGTNLNTLPSANANSSPTPSPTASPTPAPLAPTGPGAGFERITNTGIFFQQGMLNPAQVIGDRLSHLAPEVAAGGGAAGDYDNDGDIDLFIVRGDIGPNLLYQNDGTGYFTDVASEAGVAWTAGIDQNYRHSGPMFADMDGDGHLDLFLGSLEGDPVKVYRNLGDGRFTDVTQSSGLAALQSRYTISAGFGDYDRDGDLDLFLAHWGSNYNPSATVNSEHLWRNDSSGNTIQFTDVSVASNIRASVLEQISDLGNYYDTSFTPNFIDFNDDLWPDILLASDFGHSRILVNNQDGSFENITHPIEIKRNNDMGVAIGDFDNDGDFDWFVSAIQGLFWFTGNRLYEYHNDNYIDASVNSGINRESGSAQERSSWGWGACAADLNRDEFLDIYLSNGYPLDSDIASQVFDFNIDVTQVYLGNGDNTFIESATALGLDDNSNSQTAICADFDQDGDIDILQINHNTDNAASYYRNNIDSNNFLSIRLRDSTSKNTFGVGTKITLISQGITQTREVRTENNYVGQNGYQVLFGIRGSEISQLDIRWPDGTIQNVNNPTVNSHLIIEKTN